MKDKKRRDQTLDEALEQARTDKKKKKKKMAQQNEHKEKKSF